MLKKKKRILQNKKGLSTVVATISLVLLTIAAVAIVWRFIGGWVPGQLEGAECVKYTGDNAYFIFEKEYGYNCYQNISGEILYGISIKARGADNETQSKIEGFRIVLKEAGESSSLDVKSGGNVNPNRGGIRMLNSSIEKFIIPRSGEIRTYVYNATRKLKSIEIRPLLKTGKDCGKSDEVNIDKEVCVGLANMTDIR